MGRKERKLREGRTKAKERRKWRGGWGGTGKGDKTILDDSDVRLEI